MQKKEGNLSATFFPYYFRCVMEHHTGCKFANWLSRRPTLTSLCSFTIREEWVAAGSVPLGICRFPILCATKF